MRAGFSWSSLVLAMSTSLGIAGAAGAQVVHVVPTVPIVRPDDARTHGLESLRTATQEAGGVPLPPNLKKYVRDTQAAIVLGKSLFWDMAVGGDGVQACASCHFHAGADSRPQNQLNPDLKRFKNVRDGKVKGFHSAPGAPDERFEVVTGSPSVIGPNHLLGASDFPFVTRPNQWVTLADGVVGPKTPENVNDVVSSMGVYRTNFVAVTPGQAVDQGVAQVDPIFRVNGATVRRDEPRNTPTMINAVFNFTNFWDGRANNTFNGRNPFGRQDSGASIYVRLGSQRDPKLKTEKLQLQDASLASQAVGPPQSFFEMSFGDGGANTRPWPDIGKKLLSRRALQDQRIDRGDSVLGGSQIHASGKGLVSSYRQLVERAFETKYWDYPGAVVVDGKTYSHAEANFSFLFGVAVMLYEATLVADQTPFDRWMESGSFGSGFGSQQLEGLNVFVDQGRCINCHAGPELSNASVRHAQGGERLIEPMIMGDGRHSVYDDGFYNISVTLTTDDVGRGGQDPNGKPLAFSRQALFQRLGIQKMGFPIQGNDTIPALSADGAVVCQDLNLDGVCQSDEPLSEEFKRVAVDGAFKAPGLRNVELTGPYFHNGGIATLRQVVQFYDRGGNFCKFNFDDLDPDIQRIGLSARQEEDLVAFLAALTDDRVRRKAAPFDHPELKVPNGHPGDENAVTRTQVVDGVTQGQDQLLVIPAVGAAGTTPLPTFLGLDPEDNLGIEPVADGCDPVVRP